MVRSWLTDRKLYVYSSPTDDGGKEAITHYRTIKRANGFSLVELMLETGRKTKSACTCRTWDIPSLATDATDWKK